MTSTPTETRAAAPDRTLLTAVARRYYLDDRSKVEIAAEFGVSRFKVARMLRQARELGLVTITFPDDDVVDTDLSARLAAHLGLQAAVVVVAPGADDLVRDRVGRAAAEHLGRTLRPGELLGLAWGRTLTVMTEHLVSLPPVSVVQLTGAVGSDLAASPVEIVRKAALSAGGDARGIFAPLLVEDASTASALRRQPDVAEALDMFDRITTAVVAVGSWDPPESQLRGMMPDADRQALAARGVRAEVAAIFVGDDGSLVGEDYAERCLSISAEQLARIPRVIAVAGGRTKAAAVAAVARSGLVTDLVTDRALAEEVLAMPAVPARPVRALSRRAPGGR